MSIVLLALGILTAGAGAVLIGFGVPINEFSLGNTLIISGTTALVGGLVVISLAVASRHLQHIAALLRTQPVQRPARSVEGFEQAVQAQAHAASQRMPMPKLPPEGGRDMPRQPEGRFAPPDAPADPIFERLRMGTPAPQRAETPVLPDEEAPLSPRAPRIPPFPAETPVPAEAHAGTRPPEFRFPPKPAPAGPAVAEKPRGGAPQQPSRSSPFSEAWPEPGQAQPRVESAPEESAEGATRPSDPRPNGDALRSALAREIEKAPVSILKSGVVDGMAYTLYTDGSIEAELAHGVVRFGSIEELRNHLEKGG